mgnify:CR=1 FL=1
MAKHEVLIHETRNITGDGTTLYTGSYIEKESVRQAGFVGFLSAKSGLPAVQAQAILEGAFEAVEELEKESLVRIHTDLGTICGIITGSFETADAAFDPEKNSLELALRLEDAIRLSLADVVPTIVTDESLTKLRVDGLMDLATPRPYNLIHGQKVFRVSCYNMVHEDEGATVFLQDAKGVTYEVVVDRVVSKQLFEAHTAELLEAGDYKLVVKSRAGDAEGPLQTAFHRVKYLKVGKPNAPKITRVVSNVQEETLRPGCAVEIAGEHLAEALHPALAALDDTAETCVEVHALRTDMELLPGAGQIEETHMKALVAVILGIVYVVVQTAGTLLEILHQDRIYI